MTDYYIRVRTNCYTDPHTQFSRDTIDVEVLPWSISTPYYVVNKPWIIERLFGVTMESKVKKAVDECQKWIDQVGSGNIKDKKETPLEELAKKYDQHLKIKPELDEIKNGNR